MNLNEVESQGDQVAYWLARLEQGGSFDIPPDCSEPFLTAWAETHDMSLKDARKLLADMREPKRGKK